MRAVLGSVLLSLLAGPNLAIGEESGPSEASIQTDPVGASEPATPPEIYGEGVRSTEHRTPEAELAGFHLPPGFEIRLFASEPEIAKPLNMAFGSDGRLWVTNSVAYPYPAKTNQTGPDSIKILEDTDQDGRADSVTTFADGLNIPMGVLPYQDGCLCFSIPHIWFLRDTDGDGKCDDRRIVLGPFDTSRDTHGMVNSLRDGGDGWIYACHGFNNQSEVAGTDGHVVTMHSGNTFRFRPDGSRVELHTRGQVNPFGMTRDEWGYWYSADCHSKPISQLIAGACYPSFGRPDDGLGFLPPMMDHLHGSTAISGIQFFPPDSPIAPLRGRFLSGNVMTSRMNWNEREFVGATAKGRALPDFLTSDDPWFRPVDIQVDEEGNIYVADFYNKIIGHYEVPLEHPGRDRTSGRIWQIRYTGSRAGGDDSASETQRSVSQMRRSSETNPGDFSLSDLREFLMHENVHVVRMAAECLGRRGDTSDVDRLVVTLAEAAEEDVVLQQTVRIAIRDLLKRTPASDPIWDAVPGWEVASVMLGLDDGKVVAPILAALKVSSMSDVEHATSEALLSHAVSLAEPIQMDACVELAKQLAGDDADAAFEWLRLICDAGGFRATNVPTAIRVWALQLVESEWNDLTATGQVSVAWFASGDQEWRPESRLTSVASSNAERDEFAELLSSFPLGETYTGIFASDWFAAPEQIEFWLAGHNAPPGQPNPEQNRVRLRLAATDDVWKQVLPPRSDIAQRIAWDTSELKGQTVRIEVIDGDPGAAYAWLAFGGFRPERIGPSNTTTQWLRILGWVERLGLNEIEHDLRLVLSDERYGVLTRLQVASTLARLNAEFGIGILAQFVAAETGHVELSESLIEAALQQQWEATEPLKQLGPHLDASQQRMLVLDWIGNGGDLGPLFSAIELGAYSAAVLMDPDVQQAIGPRLDERLQNKLNELTDGIVLDAGKTEQLNAILVSVRELKGDASQGKAVFAKRCQSCHQLHGEGALVGPQLDGAISRSVERLIEDVVLPDRNIDAAFRTQSLLLDDGRVLVGLVTSENDETIRLTTSDGKTQEVPVDAVEIRQASKRSLMPSNLSELMTERELVDLMAHLKSSPGDGSH